MFVTVLKCRQTWELLILEWSNLRSSRKGLEPHWRWFYTYSKNGKLGEGEILKVLNTTSPLHLTWARWRWVELASSCWLHTRNDWLGQFFPFAPGWGHSRPPTISECSLTSPHSPKHPQHAGIEVSLLLLLPNEASWTSYTFPSIYWRLLWGSWHNVMRVLKGDLYDDFRSKIGAYFWQFSDKRPMYTDAKLLWQNANHQTKQYNVFLTSFKISTIS